MRWQGGLIIQMNYSKWIVYKHTSPSGKVYIGITSRTPKYRWSDGRGYIANDYFFKAIQKYGWDNIKHEILFENLTKEEAEAKEIELIEQYNSTDRACGYNISYGGSAPTSGLHWKRPKEGILSGKKHPMFGKHLTDDQKKHLSKCNSGEKHPQYGTHRSEETKRKISEAQRGKIIPEEQRKQISETLKGHVAQNRKAVVCIETGEIFESCEAAKQAKQITSLYKALRDQTKTAGGYHWQYLKERKDFTDELFVENC